MLSKSSGRVLPPHPRTCRLLSMLKNKAELVSVAMLPKIYGLCQVTFFFFLFLEAYLEAAKFKTAALFSSFFVEAPN